MITRWFLPILLAVTALTAASCNKDNDAQTAADARKLAVTKLDTSGLEVSSYDLNNDGKDDQVRYIKKGTEDKPDQLRYVTHDINFDGFIDITEFYDDNSKHIRDEIDLDYDGVCDLIVTYKDGLPVKKEFSVDFEGNRHGVQYFDEHGFLKEIRRDTDNNGKIDVIEYYHPNETEPYNVKRATPKNQYTPRLSAQDTVGLETPGTADKTADAGGDNTQSQPAPAQPAPAPSEQ